MTPIIKPAEEIDFLTRADRRYSEGATMREIAEEEGLQSPGALDGKVRGLGFRFSRIGGLKLVDALMGRPFAEWISSGDLTPAPAEEESVAA